MGAGLGLAVAADFRVTSTRATLRQGLADEIERANRHECELQQQQCATADFREGVRAMAERRAPRFEGR